jgi:DHA1 family multidrug resistance protein-like MFS transporter
MPFTTILGASDIFRDSVFGHLVRVATSDKFFYYDEERDSSLWKKFVNEGKSGNLAHHVTADDLSDDEDRPSRQLGGIGTREARNVSEDSEKDSSDVEKPDTPGMPDDGTHNVASGVRVDSEKGGASI